MAAQRCERTQQTSLSCMLTVVTTVNVALRIFYYNNFFWSIMIQRGLKIFNREKTGCSINGFGRPGQLCEGARNDWTAVLHLTQKQTPNGVKL